MGVSIHYRGKLAELDRVEDFEDRAIDLVLALGGNVRVWRSADEEDRSRVTKGLLVDLAPGQETTSLLISPEGWFIPIWQIEEAQKGLLDEPPYCSVKTQFGPLEGHVALVELLDAIRKEFAPELYIHDEGEYWESRDLAVLEGKTSFVKAAIEGLAEALKNDGLSAEAAEDPQILATRVERLARLVRQTIGKPAEHPPIEYPDEATGQLNDPDKNETLWDEIFAHNRRNQERMERVTEERLLCGDSVQEAFEAAMGEVLPDIEVDEIEEETEDDIEAAFEAQADLELELTEETFRDRGESLDIASDGEDDLPWEDEDEDGSEPPLRRRAKEFILALHSLGDRRDQSSGSLELALRSSTEMVGGLAQALPIPDAWDIDDIGRGLSLVQLKRALRGAAFVKGSLFLLVEYGVIDERAAHRHHEEIDAISQEIVALIRHLRNCDR